MKSELLRKLLQKANNLPQTPGVYIMKNCDGEIIYIGKAKKLKNRVSQYFARFETHIGKTRRMVENVFDFEYILTTTELEALTLECAQIKQHRPKYNILLKDDRGFCFIRKSTEQYPRFSVVYKKKEDGAIYYGPYMSAGAARQLIEFARKLFLIPACNRKLEYGKRSERPCLNYFIKQCSAPCTGKVLPEAYAENLKDAEAMIVGGVKKTLDEMTARMKEYSDNLEFEKAARIRDKINAINKINQRQVVVSDECKEHDVFSLITDGVTVCVCVLNVREGKISLKEDFFFSNDDVEGTEEFVQSFICEYYSQERVIPPVVAVVSELEEYSLLKNWLSEKRGRRCSLRCKNKGELPKTAKICVENAQEALVQYSVRRGARGSKAAEELKLHLGIKGELKRIEAYDVSHTGGKGTVGGMVVFENCSPKKSDYRKYRISVTGGDDYAATREMLSRRIARLGEEGFARPDLILLDGGDAHVAVIAELFRELKVDIPLYGMVKDGKHSFRALVSEKGEVELSRTSRAFRLLSAISEEVHRYAISFHRNLRSSELRSSELLIVDGIGEARAKALLKAFGSIEAMRKANVDELASVKGMNLKAAENLVNYFSNVPSDE